MQKIAQMVNFTLKTSVRSSIHHDTHVRVGSEHCLSVGRFNLHIIDDLTMLGFVIGKANETRF